MSVKNLAFRSVEFVESGYGGFSLVTTGNDTVPTIFTFLGPDVLRGISCTFVLKKLER